MKARTRSRRLGRPPLPRRPLEWGLAVLAVVLVVIAITSLGNGSSVAAATKRTVTVGKGVVQSTVSGNGALEPAEKVELNFGTAGEVTAIRVKAGQKVSKGEVLAEIDSSSARASLASAEAKSLEAEEALEAAEEAAGQGGESAETAYAGEGRTVFVALTSKAGTAVATSEKTPAEETAATPAEKTAPEGGTAPEGKTAPEENAATAKPTTGKSAPAEGKEEAATPAEEKGEAAAPEPAREAPAEVEATAASGSSPAAGGGEVGGAEGAATGATVSVPTAEANLREAELAVKSARQEVRETTLRAPISGTITTVSGAVGENVSGESSGAAAGGSSEAAIGGLGAASGGSGESSSGSAFMVLAQVHRLKMEVSFSESDIGKVRAGQSATVAVDALEGIELAGRVTTVSALPSEGSSSVVEYPATIIVTQSAKGVRAGMSASAEVVVEQVKNAITVPSEAISAAGGKTVTVEADGKEVTKSVSTGLVGDETTQVISGLKAGETVVLPETTVAGTGLGGSGGSESGGFPRGGGFPGGGAGGFSPPTGGGFPAGRLP